MHDGRNTFDASAMGSEWQLDEAAQRLIGDGEIQPIIVVGIDNTADRIDEYTPTQRQWRHVMERVTQPNGAGRLRPLTGAFTTAFEDTIYVGTAGDSLMVQLPGGNFWQQAHVSSDFDLLRGSGRYHDAVSDRLQRPH